MSVPEACVDAGAWEAGGAVASKSDAAADWGVPKPAAAPNKDVAGDQALCDATGGCLKLNAPRPPATWHPMNVNSFLRVY